MYSLAARPINNRWLAWALGERTGFLCCKINDFLQAFHMDRCRRVCSFVDFTETLIQQMAVEIFMSPRRWVLRSLRSPSPNPHTLNDASPVTIIKPSSQFLFFFAALYIMCTTPFIPFNYVSHSCRTRWLQSSLSISRAVDGATLFMFSTTPVRDPWSSVSEDKAPCERSCAIIDLYRRGLVNDVTRIKSVLRWKRNLKLWTTKQVYASK